MSEWIKISFAAHLGKFLFEVGTAVVFVLFLFTAFCVGEWFKARQRKP